MIYHQIKAEYDQICARISSIQSELQTLPDGKLICCHQQNSAKWYHCNQHQRIYIPKSNRPLAEQLVRKKYFLSLLSDLEKEKKALSYYLKHHTASHKAEDLLTTSSEYRNLLLPYFKPTSLELEQWMNSPYDKNEEHPENLIHKGVADTYLRSKSEVLIDMLLRMHQIPFRYECALPLGSNLVYPDFTIRHPHTGTLYYWEHFGLMDHLPYIEKTTSKLHQYATHGITPGIQLITTYETKTAPLSPDVVEKLIQHYFT